jgi:hypothetical protein
MYLDGQTLLSDAQAFSATGYTTNTIDTGNVTPKNDLGDGEPMVMCIGVDVAADAGNGDETYQFDYVQSANANLSSHTVLQSRVISRTLLTAGSLHFVDVPAGAQTARYVGGQLVLGGTTPSITVTIWLAPKSMVDRFKAYAKGYTIS